MSNNNQPPPPTAGFVNDQQLPPPPKPNAPGVDQPTPQPPQPMVRKPNAVVAAKEPSPVVYQVLMAAGWIPVDKGSLSGTSEQIMGANDHPVSFMSENGKYMIACRSSAIYATKTKYE